MKYIAPPHQLNLLVPEAVTTHTSPCPSCGTTQVIQTAGTGPHYAGLRCASCNRFVKWLAKPKSGGAV